MIKEITELNFMGYHLEQVKNTGWKIVLNDVEFLFPTMQDAQAACKKFRDIVKENRGKVIATVTEKDNSQRDLLRHLENAKAALDNNHLLEAKLILSSLIEDTKEATK